MVGLRFGIISDIDVQKCYARVKFLDDGIVSDWLQIVVMGALSTKFFHMFDINEQVAVLMDENSEDGVILGALFNDNTPPDTEVTKDKVRVLFPDESFIEYDRASSEWTADIKGTINLRAESEINIESDSVVNIEAEMVNVDASEVSVDADHVEIVAPIVEVTGEVTVTGNLTVSGTVTASTAISSPSISGPGVTMVSGNIDASGEVKGATVKAGPIDLGTHKHSGVTTGSGTSGTPTP